MERASRASVTVVWPIKPILPKRSHVRSSSNVAVRSRPRGCRSKRRGTCFGAGAGCWHAGPSAAGSTNRTKARGSILPIVRRRRASECSCSRRRIFIVTAGGEYRSSWITGRSSSARVAIPTGGRRLDDHRLAGVDHGRVDAPRVGSSLPIVASHRADQAHPRPSFGPRLSPTRGTPWPPWFAANSGQRNRKK